jgi:flavin-dependent dehydrogenase
VPVTVREAGHYPRHRVCGEFISGRGQAVLARLGLRESFERAGAGLAKNAAFFLGQSGSPVRSLAQPALCLSRFVMDALLAGEFEKAGGDLRQRAKWSSRESEEGVVRTSGRRLQPQENGWRWFGLKVHARKVALGADLEMHGSQSGYVGLCRLNAQEVNVCGLFRHRAGAEATRPWQEMLRGAPGTPLRERLGESVFDDNSFCAVAGIALRPRHALDLTECCLGDALTMIPPVTGNGMSMAFEAADLAVQPLAAYSRGDIAWPEARQQVALACDRAFARRLFWARWLQFIMFAPLFRGPLGRLALQSDLLWNLLFARTR